MPKDKTKERMATQIRKGIEKATRQARKVGGKVAHAVAETPEYISLQRNDRALRSEMDDRMQTIGKRALLLHKRSKGKSPFLKFKTILQELEKLEHLEDEYRANRVRLSAIRQEMRGKGRKR